MSLGSGSVGTGSRFAVGQACPAQPHPRTTSDHLIPLHASAAHLSKVDMADRLPALESIVEPVRGCHWSSGMV